MSQRYRISFETPPFQVIASHLMDDESFQSDVRRIVDIADSEFDSLSRALSEYSEFLGDQQLGSLVSEHITEEASEISRTVARLAAMLRDAKESPKSAMKVMRRKIIESLPNFSTDEKESVANRIEQLCLDPPGLNLQHKAEELSNATGSEVEKLQIVCDVRPVFDEARERIASAIPVCVMRIDYDTNGTPGSLELRLNNES